MEIEKAMKVIQSCLKSAGKESDIDEVRSRLFSGLCDLTPVALKLLVKKYGLDGEERLNESEIAQELGMTTKNSEDLEADALRALVGYGSNYQNRRKESLEQ
jgi:DNA-directed RNA polymerase sigma subunit (sigma70/sigma32)